MGARFNMCFGGEQPIGGVLAGTNRMLALKG